MLYAVLPVLILLAILITYHDIRKGIIRNRYILALAILGLIYQLSSGISLTQAFQVLLALSYGFLISLLLWYIGIWPGGDAKLFTVLTLFFQPGIYSTILILPYLMNTFIPIFLFMIIMVLIRSRGRDLAGALRYSLEPYRLSFLLMIIVGFMWLFTGLIEIAGIQADYFITIIILFVVYEIFSLTLSAKAEFLFIGLVILRVVLDFQNLFTLASLYYILLLAGTFVFFRFFLLYISYHSLTTIVSLKELKPGMVPAEAISLEKGRYSRISLINSSLVDFLQQKRRSFIHSLDSLTRSDISRIKTLSKKRRIRFSRIRIYQTQPFAGFIFLGYFITLLLQGSIVSLFI